MRLTFLILTLALFAGACNNPPKTAEVAQVTVQLPQDFLDFYEKFHQDSLYQTQHIVWPLQGDMAEQVDSTRAEKKPARWQQADWRMQTLAGFNTKDYLLERQMLGDVLIIERIRPKAANYGLERRFAKQGDGEWALIYYSDMQEIR